MRAATRYPGLHRPTPHRYGGGGLAGAVVDGG
jgi:hypothetical protein